MGSFCNILLESDKRKIITVRLSSWTRF